jgi:pyrroline-5-carboxylate reductase
VNTFSIAFIGAGNMAGSIIGGLLASGLDASLLRASCRSESSLSRLREQGLGRVGTDNVAVASGADVVVLAVKPKQLREVCEALAPQLQPGQLVMSVAAGVEAHSLSRWLGGHAAVVRCMPNTPSQLGAGASGLFALAGVEAEQRRQAETIMGAVGIVQWVEEESLLHAVTAIAGSAPAYFFLFLEAMMDEGRRMGLDAEAVRILSAQTCVGAGRMVLEGEGDAAQLRHRVCSPGGTTERAVAALMEGGLEALVAKAMRDCYARSEELGRELS